MGVGTHYTYTAPLVRGTGNENCYQTYNGDQPQKQPRHPLPAPSWLSRRAAPASARARACGVLTAARAGGCGGTGAQTRNAVAPAGQAPHLPAPPGNAAHRPCCHGSLPKWRCFKSEKKKSPFLHTQKNLLLSCAGRDETTVTTIISRAITCTAQYTQAHCCVPHTWGPPILQSPCSPSVFIQAKSRRKGKSHSPPGCPQAGSPSPPPDTAFRASPTSADPTPGWLMSDQLPSWPGQSLPTPGRATGGEMTRKGQERALWLRTSRERCGRGAWPPRGRGHGAREPKAQAEQDRGEKGPNAARRRGLRGSRPRVGGKQRRAEAARGWPRRAPAPVENSHGAPHTRGPVSP